MRAVVLNMVYQEILFAACVLFSPMAASLPLAPKRSLWPQRSSSGRERCGARAAASRRLAPRDTLLSAFASSRRAPVSRVC